MRRPAVGLWLLLLGGLVASGYDLWQGSRLDATCRRSDEILQFEECLRELPPLLPVRAVLGYDDSQDDERGYYIAQYVLVPHLVYNDTNRPLVIGSVDQEGKRPRTPAGKPFVLVRDLGGGLGLFRSEAR